MTNTSEENKWREHSNNDNYGQRVYLALRWERNAVFKKILSNSWQKYSWLSQRVFGFEEREWTVSEQWFSLSTSCEKKIDRSFLLLQQRHSGDVRDNVRDERKEIMLIFFLRHWVCSELYSCLLSSRFCVRTVLSLSSIENKTFFHRKRQQSSEWYTRLTSSVTSNTTSWRHVLYSLNLIGWLKSTLRSL